MGRPSAQIATAHRVAAAGSEASTTASVASRATSIRVVVGCRFVIADRSDRHCESRGGCRGHCRREDGQRQQRLDDPSAVSVVSVHRLVVWDSSAFLSCRSQSASAHLVAAAGCVPTIRRAVATSVTTIRRASACECTVICRSDCEGVDRRRRRLRGECGQSDRRCERHSASDGSFLDRYHGSGSPFRCEPARRQTRWDSRPSRPDRLDSGDSVGMVRATASARRAPETRLHFDNWLAAGPRRSRPALWPLSGRHGALRSDG